MYGYVGKCKGPGKKRAVLIGFCKCNMVRKRTVYLTTENLGIMPLETTNLIFVLCSTSCATAAVVLTHIRLGFGRLQYTQHVYVWHDVQTTTVVSRKSIGFFDSNAVDIKTGKNGGQSEALFPRDLRNPSKERTRKSVEC